MEGAGIGGRKSMHTVSKVITNATDAGGFEIIE